MDIVQNLERLLEEKEFEEMIPWYWGFRGTIAKNEEQSKKNGFVMEGLIKETSYGFVIDEIPIDCSITKYRTDVLDPLCSSNKINDYKEYHTLTKISFQVYASSEQIDQIKKEQKDLKKLFNLRSYISLNTMVLHNAENKLHRFESVKEIMLEFFKVRFGFYEKRKDYLIARTEESLKILANKMRFILEAISEEYFTLRNTPKMELFSKLQEREFDICNNTNDYDYLLKMPLWSITKEHVDKLQKEHNYEKEVLEDLKRKSPKQMWLDDLQYLKNEYMKYEERRIQYLGKDDKKKSKPTKKPKMKTKK